MHQTKHSFCRICEPCCPLIIEFDGQGKIAQIHPDGEHPAGSIACHKGLSFLDVHNDPDRLNWPQKRLNARAEDRGEFVDIDWDSAMAEIAGILTALREQSGPNCVAIYYGNAWSFTNPTALLATSDFRALFGTTMMFSSNTQDTANKFVGAAAIYGSSGAVMIPDINNTDYLLCLGSNPKVSRWTTMSVPNDGLDVLKAIRRRGGKVRFVNPRRTESSTTETGPTLLIKPATDVYFLAALLNEIECQGGFDAALLSQYGKHVDEMKGFVRHYPAERVADVTGIEAQTIRDVAREMIAAKSAAVYMATGLNQSRQGIIAYWLVEMINFCTGNLGKVGGTYKPTGLADMFPPSGGTQTVETSLGSFRLPDPLEYAVLPAALLSHLIESGDIRALIVLGGNPVLTVGGEGRLRDAFQKLELLVSVDIFRQATAEMADYILPSTDWLEHMDINLYGSGLQQVPYVQYTDAMEVPAAGRRNGWWVLARLAQALGLRSPLDDRADEIDGHDAVNGLLSLQGLSIDKMRALPRNSHMIEPDGYDALFKKCLQHADGKIDCYPNAFVEAGLLERCDVIFAGLAQEPSDMLKLISLRTPYMQNSWLANVAKFRLGRQAVNPLNMTEADAAARGLHDGDDVRVFNEYGSIETQIFINNDLRPGVAAMTHGYGHSKTYGLRVANRKPGANCNALMPVGADVIEPMSYMSWMTGIPIEVERLAPPTNSFDLPRSGLVGVSEPGRR